MGHKRKVVGIKMYDTVIRYTVKPRYFEVTRDMKKKFKIAGFQNNRDSSQ